MHANLYAQILDGILYLFTHLSFQKCIKRVNYVARLDVLDQLYYASDQPTLDRRTRRWALSKYRGGNIAACCSLLDATSLL